MRSSCRTKHRPIISLRESLSTIKTDVSRVYVLANDLFNIGLIFLCHITPLKQMFRESVKELFLCKCLKSTHRG